MTSWTCRGVAHSFCTAVKRLSESKKRRQDCLMSSAQSFYGPCLQSVAHSLTCCFSECATPPHVQVHRTTWLSFTRPSPVLVLQATNAGARRPGYEVTIALYSYLTCRLQPVETCQMCWLIMLVYDNYCKFLQHLVARSRTLPANQIPEGFEFYSLIGSQCFHCCTGSCKNLENTLEHAESALFTWLHGFRI